ncbi:MAG: family 1 glycosylhydrolase [Firmicutes bacterium]|uniref:Glycosyl transferase n=1 Tax=Sulfobacillus benefaciens TaxID=453960 RepID=A0A2T2X6F6_9FIRM|nr:family 1 glycosylhydrolase [Bacillota bacterium]MCL5015625.1 family 1 glycosylhydrolase [Bacillota bacterium]PSR30055.1 MAG: glycosyl transferase [Sulfobacillus benefaciens]
MMLWPQNTTPFLWGVATSAHQVEGDTDNDWTEWENSEHVVEKSGNACLHYQKYADDLQLFSQIGVNAYRYSLEWSRIEPEPGQFNQNALDHYRAMTETVISHRMEPLITLHHFTLPKWFAKQGGFFQREAPRLFSRYVQKVLDTVGDLARFYVTINEPLVYAVMGYGNGQWPPGHQNLKELWQIVPKLLACHQEAYHRIKARRPGAMAGLAHHLMAFAPYDARSWLDRWNARLLHFLFNWRFIQWTRNTSDFIGVNYYTQQYAHHRQFLVPVAHRPDAGLLTDMGWEIHPNRLEDLLIALKRFDKPLLITENGIATSDDSVRQQFLIDHLAAVSRAQNQGAMVRGYFYWSALDNFEWAEGYRPRFGLVRVDYETQKRTLRDSAYLYRRIIDANQGRWPISVPPEPEQPVSVL